MHNAPLHFDFTDDDTEIAIFKDIPYTRIAYEKTRNGECIMRVQQIKIEFNVTPQIRRYVFVYLMETDEGCYLIDSGVAGSEHIIEKSVKENGHHPSDIKAVFLTHAHPDHIGTAFYFREKYGAAIYASEGERAWIEDIDLQFARRPIPNFYMLAGKSVPVDYVVKDGDEIVLSDRIRLNVIGTPGHSVDEVSYQINDMVFIGDAVPVKGDIPIFINLEKTKNSLMKLEALSNVKWFYPAWDQAYSAEMLKRKIMDAKELVTGLEEAVAAVDVGMENSELVDLVCRKLNMPMLKDNPLFSRTVECCRKVK